MRGCWLSIKFQQESHSQVRIWLLLSGGVHVSIFRYHFKSKHTEQTYQCSSCTMQFQHPYRLRVHVRKYHENQTRRVFRCDFCSLKLTTKSSLRDHIRVHTGEKPYVCQHCSRFFRTNQQLKTHQVVHTKEKPFGCWLCPKKFTQKSSLGVHVRNCHSQDKKH